MVAQASKPANDPGDAYHASLGNVEERHAAYWTGLISNHFGPLVLAVAAPAPVRARVTKVRLTAVVLLDDDRLLLLLQLRAWRRCSLGRSALARAVAVIPDLLRRGLVRRTPDRVAIVAIWSGVGRVRCTG